MRPGAFLSAAANVSAAFAPNPALFERSRKLSVSFLSSVARNASALASPSAFPLTSKTLTRAFVASAATSAAPAASPMAHRLRRSSHRVERFGSPPALDPLNSEANAVAAAPSASPIPPRRPSPFPLRSSLARCSFPRRPCASALNPSGPTSQSRNESDNNASFSGKAAARAFAPTSPKPALERSHSARTKSLAARSFGTIPSSSHFSRYVRGIATRVDRSPARLFSRSKNAASAEIAGAYLSRPSTKAAADNALRRAPFGAFVFSPDPFSPPPPPP